MVGVDRCVGLMRCDVGVDLVDNLLGESITRSLWQGRTIFRLQRKGSTHVVVLVGTCRNDRVVVDLGVSDFRCVVDGGQLEVG